CLKYGFENLKLKKIIGQVLIENAASVRVLEKIGMRFEREAIFHGAPGIIYSIEKKQFIPEPGNF
ncbi:MAG: GNAT family protein, partial [Bacteroidota bacterium]